MHIITEYRAISNEFESETVFQVFFFKNISNNISLKWKLKFLYCKWVCIREKCIQRESKFSVKLSCPDHKSIFYGYVILSHFVAPVTCHSSLFFTI